MPTYPSTTPTYSWWGDATLFPLLPSEVTNTTWTRWQQMRITSDDPEAMEIYWKAWVYITYLSSISSLTVILIICCNKSLHNYQNRFIVGLAIPDVLFSGLCGITCQLNTQYGVFQGGPGMCLWQSFYVVFGFAGSMWMNVVITRELHRLSASLEGKADYYSPPKACEVYKRIAMVYAGCVVLALVPFLGAIPGFPLHVGAHRALACLPMTNGVGSELFFWLLFVNVMLIIPFSLISYYLYNIYTSLLAGNLNVDTTRRATGTGSDAAQAPSKRMTRMTEASKWLSGKFNLQKILESTNDAAAKKLIDAHRTLVNFFVRVFMVFVAFWIPAALLIWMAAPNDIVVPWIGGTISHLQGLASACMYIRKPDIWEEVMRLLGRIPRRSHRKKSLSVVVSAGSIEVDDLTSPSALGSAARSVSERRTGKFKSRWTIPGQEDAAGSTEDAGAVASPSWVEHSASSGVQIGDLGAGTVACDTNCDSAAPAGVVQVNIATADEES